MTDKHTESQSVRLSAGDAAWILDLLERVADFSSVNDLRTVQRASDVAARMRGTDGD